MQDNAIKSLTAGQTIRVPTAREMDLQQARSQIERPTIVTANNQSYGNTPTGSFIAGGGTLALGNTPTIGGLSPDERGAARPVVPTGSFVSGGGQVNVPRPSTDAFNETRFITNRTPINRPPAQSSFISGSGQVNTGGQGTVQGNFGGAVNAVVNQPVTPARPQGMFTGNPNDPNTAAWRNYWNYSAQHPESVPSVAPLVMTRDQVWNMKAAQRRIDAANNEGDSQTVGYQPYLQPVLPTYEPFFGNNIVQGVWRAG